MMSNLTDRAAYLRGVADGMQLDSQNPQNKLMLELLSLVDEMAHKLSEVEDNVDELTDYVNDIDEDLEELESYLYDEDDDDEDGCCDHCGCGCDCEGEDEDIHFECPNCGKPVVINPDDIEKEEAPKCPYCGEPFFTECEDDEQE